MGCALVCFVFAVCLPLAGLPVAEESCVQRSMQFSKSWTLMTSETRARIHQPSRPFSFVHSLLFTEYRCQSWATAARDFCSPGRDPLALDSFCSSFPVLLPVSVPKTLKRPEAWPKALSDREATPPSRYLIAQQHPSHHLPSQPHPAWSLSLDRFHGEPRGTHYYSSLQHSRNSLPVQEIHWPSPIGLVLRRQFANRHSQHPARSSGLFPSSSQ